MKRRLISGLVEKMKKVGSVVGLGVTLYFAGSTNAGEPGKIVVTSQLPRKTLVAGM